MIVHNLKIKYEYAKAIASKEKTFELRKDDRNFQVGDYIAFEVVNRPNMATPEGVIYHRVRRILDENIYKITYKLSNVSEYGLDPEYCILAIKAINVVNIPSSPEYVSIAKKKGAYHCPPGPKEKI